MTLEQPPLSRRRLTANVAQQLFIRLSLWPRRWTVFPIALFIGILLMSALEISGSSVSLAWPTQSDPIAGAARPVRSDEWWVRTPMILHQEANGFPNSAIIGMGSHDQGVIADLPTSHITMFLRPHLWAYHVLPLENAFAFEWWGVLSLSALGPYGLLWIFTRKAMLSSLLGIGVLAAPVVQWWTSTSACTSIGYLCFGVTALLVAAVESGWRRPAFAFVSGWMFACAAAVPYPAWLLPLGLALVPLAATGLFRGRGLGETVRATWKVLAGIGLVALVGAATYIWVHRNVFESLTTTVYPGDRNQTGETGDILRLLGAPFYWDVVRNPAGAPVLGTNESEAAGPYFLLLPAAVAFLGGLLAPTRSTRWRPASSCLLGALGLLIWFLVPIPASIGSLLGLDQVPPNRLLHTFAPIGAICLGLVLHALDDFNSKQRRQLAWATAVVVFLSTAWAGAHFTIGSTVIPADRTLLISFAIATFCAILISRHTLLGTAGLVLMMLGTAVQTNPIQRGLEPLLATPLTATIKKVSLDHPGSWVSSTDDTSVIASLVASGVDTISGASIYPDRQSWLIIDPDESDVDIWNRFAHIFVSSIPGGEPSRLNLLQADALLLELDLCGQEARSLSIKMVILDLVDEVPTCGTLITITPGPSGDLQLVALAQDSTSRPLATMSE